MATLSLNKTAGNLLDLQAKSFIEQKQFHSIAWRLIQSGDVMSDGIRSVNPSELPSVEPIYRIYSMTKPIVSIVALQLIEENKLSLAEPVAKYIPAFEKLQVLSANGSTQAIETPITIEHLLTHTAGFSYDFMPNCAVAEKYREAQLSGDASRSLAEVIGLLTAMPLASQPGTQWRYSVAIDVLAHVLENVSGESLPDLLQQRIFQPLHMHDTAFNVSSESQSRLLPMFGARDLGQVLVQSTEPNELNALNVDSSYPSDSTTNFYRGGHGLFSTMADYLKFMQVLSNGKSLEGECLLSEKTVSTMWSGRMPSAVMPLVLGFDEMFGYNWNLFGRVMQEPEQALIRTVKGEGGWSGAASTYFWVDRDNDISGIIMCQYLGSTTHLGPVMQHAGYGMFK